jgi:hypothetical protein
LLKLRIKVFVLLRHVILRKKVVRDCGKTPSPYCSLRFNSTQGSSIDAYARSVVKGAPCLSSSRRLNSSAGPWPSRHQQSSCLQCGSASAIVLRHAPRFAICQSPPSVAQPGVRADAPGSAFYFAFHRAARRSIYTLGLGPHLHVIEGSVECG